MTDPATLKECRACQVLKARSQFAKCARAADRLQSYCRDCNTSAVREWRQRIKFRRYYTP